MKRESVFAVMALTTTVLVILYGAYTVYVERNADSVAVPGEVPAVNAPVDANHDHEGHSH
jgi:hypothetical protein